MEPSLNDERHAATTSTAGGLPIAPSLEVTLEAVHAPRQSAIVDHRVIWLTGVAVYFGAATAGIAQLLTALIGLVTNIAFSGRLSTAMTSPAGNKLGLFAIVANVATLQKFTTERRRHANACWHLRTSPRSVLFRLDGWNIASAPSAPVCSKRINVPIGRAPRIRPKSDPSPQQCWTPCAVRENPLPQPAIYIRSGTCA